ncbi:MAG: hypothetical protein WBN72_02195 [Nitrososphaeraceae archaeon]
MEIDTSLIENNHMRVFFILAGIGYKVFPPLIPQELEWKNLQINKLIVSGITKSVYV